MSQPNSDTDNPPQYLHHPEQPQNGLTQYPSIQHSEQYPYPVKYPIPSYEPVSLHGPIVPGQPSGYTVLDLETAIPLDEKPLIHFFNVTLK